MPTATLPATIEWWNNTLGQAEIDSVADAIRNRCVSLSKRTFEFEQRLASLLDVPYVVCVTSGTSALMMTYLAIGLRPGDEIIIPNRTAVATAHAAMLLGATVRIIDVRADKCVIDENRIESEITPQTRAIVPVSMNGVAVNLKAIKAIADKHGLEVIEDACQSLFSRNADGFLGTQTRFGCYSLGLAKLIATGQGGVVVCHTDDDVELLRRIRNQGVTEIGVDKRYNILAGNFKFIDLQAAVGMAQLDRREDKIARQIAIHNAYAEGLKDLRAIRFLPVAIDKGELPLRAECLCRQRDQYIQTMARYGVGLLSHAPSLSDMPHLNATGDYPNSKVYALHQFLLPCGPDQPLENVERAIEVACDIDDQFQPWE